MSELLLQQAAEIRDETKPSANTATRIGLCLEGIIRDFDNFTSRFPSSRVPPLVIDISQLDSMKIPSYARLDMDGIGAFFIVTREDPIKGNAPLNVGVLEVFSDSMSHVITQIFKTHESLTESGQFDGSHDHNHIYVYTRSYGLHAASSFPDFSPAYFPANGWGRWRPMTALPPQLGDNNGMAGFMSAKDKYKLDFLSPLKLSHRKNPDDVWPALYYFDQSSPQEDFIAFFKAHSLELIVDKAMNGAPIIMTGESNSFLTVRIRSYEPSGSGATVMFEFSNIVLTLIVSTTETATSYQADRVIKLY